LRRIARLFRHGKSSDQTAADATGRAAHAGRAIGRAPAPGDAAILTLDDVVTRLSEDLEETLSLIRNMKTDQDPTDQSR